MKHTVTFKYTKDSCLLGFADLWHMWQATCKCNIWISWVSLPCNNCTESHWTWKLLSEACERIVSSDVLVWCLGKILQNNAPGKHSNGPSMNIIYNNYNVYQIDSWFMCPKFTTCWNSDQYPQPYFFPKSRWDVEEITVLGVQHHAHLVGKRLKVEVTRDGEYIGTLEKQMWRQPRWNKHPYQQVEHLYV